MHNIRPISLIVCTHNRAELLQGLLGMLRTQDYPIDAFEIIVVDNSSTDHTRRVVEQLGAQPGVPVRYEAESRLGITFARNRGAQVARYPYLAYLDDDCGVEPDWLSELVQGFEVREDVVVVGGRVVVDWAAQERPAWLGPELEPWLAGYGFSGDQPQLLDKDARVIECNMALKRDAWQAAGGFLGMEQFGSRHMASSEVLYMLKQIERQGGRVAFVPGAVAHHYIGARNRRWMLRRAFWQGVSDGILDYLIERRALLATTGQVILDVAATFVLLGYSCIAYLKGDQPKGLYHLLRAMRRFSRALCSVRLVGDWRCVRSWILDNNRLAEQQAGLLKSS